METAKTYLDLIRDGEIDTMGFCEPFHSEDGKLQIAVIYNSPPQVCAAYEDGEEIEGGMKDGSLTAEQIHALAARYNEFYADYRGWDDLHILTEALQRIRCDECPARGDCEAVNATVDD